MVHVTDEVCATFSGWFSVGFNNKNIFLLVLNKAATAGIFAHSFFQNVSDCGVILCTALSAADRNCSPALIKASGPAEEKHPTVGMSSLGPPGSLPDQFSSCRLISFKRVCT